MQAAAALILQREEARRKKARKRAKQQRQEEHKSVQKKYHSIEVIKWCIVAICTVWLISFIISIVVLVKVNDKVAQIDAEVQRIRHVLDNPFSTAGARLGGQFDDKLKDFFKLPEPQSDAE